MSFSKKIILNIIRGIFAFFALLAVIMVIIFSFKEAYVDALDKFIVNRYAAQYADRLKHAKSLLKKDKLKSILILESLLEDLEDIKIMDRLAPIKRDCFILLSTHFREEGATEKALSLVNLWVAFNERDLSAQAERGKLLFSISGRREEGESVLEELFSMAPEVRNVANAYADILIIKGRMTDAFIVLSKNFEFNNKVPSGAWQVFWDLGDNFSAKNKKNFSDAIDSDGFLTLRFELDPNTKRLRIDPPPYSGLLISDSKLIIKENGKDISLKLSQIPLKFHQMSQVEDTLKTSSGNDPFFYWKIPDRIRGKRLSAVFVAKVSIALPEKMKELAKSPKSKMIESDLLDRRKMVEVNLLKRVMAELIIEQEAAFRLKLKSIMESTIDLYWTNRNGIFSENRKSRASIELISKEGKFEFDVSLTLGTKVTQIRIDFPNILGVTYFINSLELIGDKHGRLMNFEKETILKLHNLDRQGNYFKVTGLDPHFSFVLPKSENLIDFVHMVGRVQ